MHAGERVWLLPFEETAQPRQRGTVLQVDATTCVVELDREFRDDEYDDGLREVPFDQVELMEEN